MATASLLHTEAVTSTSRSTACLSSRSRPRPGPASLPHRFSPLKWHGIVRSTGQRATYNVCSTRRWQSVCRASLAQGKQPGDPAGSVKQALKDLKAAFRALPQDSFSSLPGDLKAELQDAGFALSSGPVLLELGDALGSTLLDLGRGMEQAQTRQAVDAASSLVARLERRTAALGSSERAVLGRRLKASGRYIMGMGSSAPKEIKQLGSAMLALGEEFSRGSRETTVDAAAVYGKKSFKVGPMEVEVTASQAALGSFIAGIFSISTWKAVALVDSGVQESVAYSSAGANLVAASLTQTLLLSGYGTAALSFITCVGLGALAIQLAPPPDDTE